MLLLFDVVEHINASKFERRHEFENTELCVLLAGVEYLVIT
jgi:hypothetical protein